MTDCYLIHLRPLYSDIPVIIRLRRALKALLRLFRFECTMIDTTTAIARSDGNLPDVAGHLAKQGSMAVSPGTA